MAMHAGAQHPAAAAATRRLPQPRGLWALLPLAVAERWSTWGLRAVLVLLLAAPTEEGGRGLGVPLAAALAALAVAVPHAAAVAGAWVADRAIGARSAVSVGAILAAAGHVAMLGRTAPAWGLGVVLALCGAGLLRPNLSTLLGGVYAERDLRRGPGLALWSRGLTAGALLATLVVGAVAEHVDRHLALALPAAVVVPALAAYGRGGRHLGNLGRAPTRPVGAASLTRLIQVAAGVSAAVAVAALVDVAAGWFTRDHAVVALALAAIAVPAAVAARAARGAAAAGAGRREVRLWLALGAAGAVFWLVADQASGAALLVAGAARPAVGGVTVPAAWFLAVGPALALVLAPPLAALLVAAERRAQGPPGPGGLLAAGLGTAGLGFCAVALAAAGAAPSWWLLVAYALLGVGEIAVSTGGLRASARLAPPAASGGMVDAWPVTAAAGNGAAALVALAYDAVGGPAYFFLLGLTAVATALAVAAARVQPDTGRV